jgi:adenylate cyclase
MDEETSRLTAVLFADVSGSTKLYELAGDAIAFEAIGNALTRVAEITKAEGGRVIKTIGDEVLALFPSADAAARASAAMHGAMEALPPVGGMRLALRIGFQAGPVIQKDNDVFGDTVNLAARLVAQAQKEQIITSGETAELLSPFFRNTTRKLYGIAVKGKAEEVQLCEVQWRQDLESTQFVATKPRVRPAVIPLRLKYRGKEIVRQRDNEAVVLGRESDCALIVGFDGNASRRHCTIERRGDKWVLKDHSTNGTYVTIEGDKEILLQREELTLRKKGWIACGLSRSEMRGGPDEIIEYFAE